MLNHNIQNPWYKTMTMALDKSQYKINEKHTSIPKYNSDGAWVSLCLCPIFHSDPVSLLNDRCFDKLHTYIFKIGMIQSKSSWFAWARTMPFHSLTLNLLQMLYFFLKKKLWSKCLMLVEHTYTSMKGSIAFKFV